jgi:hypothetical protein
MGRRQSRTLSSLQGKGGASVALMSARESKSVLMRARADQIRISGPATVITPNTEGIDLDQ